MIRRLTLAAMLLAAPAQATEFYIGAFGTATFIDSTVRRGTLEFVDQGTGGDGFGTGLRAGIALRPIQRLYTGVEVEGIAQFNTTSRNSAINYTLDIHGAAAIHGRVGYEWPSRGLVFLRGGGAYVWTNQGGYTTPTIGGGLEVYLSHRWSLRADATYYWPNGTDNVELVTITGGLSLRF